MSRETARGHLCSRYAAVIAARARTTSRLTPRPSYKSLSRIKPGWTSALVTGPFRSVQRTWRCVVHELPDGVGYAPPHSLAFVVAGARELVGARGALLEFFSPRKDVMALLCLSRRLGRFSHVRDPRCVPRRSFSLANAQVPFGRLRTGERCAVVSDGARCRTYGCAPPALWPS